MAITTFDPREEYVGAGNLASYTFDFKIASLEHLLVLVTDDDYSETFRVRGSDTTYLDSVTLNANGGGTVVLADNLPAGHFLTILQAYDEPLQSSEFRDKGTFTLRRIEDALDAVVGPMQRLAYLAKRSLRLPDNLVDSELFDPIIPLYTTDDGVIDNSDRVLAIGDDNRSLKFGPTTATISAAVTSSAASATTAATQAAASAAQAATSAASAASAAASVSSAATEAASAAASAVAAADAADLAASSAASISGAVTASAASAAAALASEAVTEADVVTTNSNVAAAAASAAAALASETAAIDSAADAAASEAAAATSATTAATHDILYGSGAPSNGLGVNGNSYIDTVTGSFYKKASGTWTLQVLLTGVSDVTQTDLDEKLDKSANLTDLTDVTAALVALGLDRVNNTNDDEKALSDEAVDALALKANITDVDSALAGKASTAQAVPGGGTINQVLAKASSVSLDAAWVSLTKSSVGLGNVDNVSDASKPISTLTQTALDGKISLSTVTAKGNILAGTGNAAVAVLVVGSNGQVLMADSTQSSGVKWATPASTPLLAVASKTTTYTATVADDVLLCSASGGSWTLTLPAAASSTGKVLHIKKTDSSANTVTADGNSSENIDGATTFVLSSQYESISIVCDGSNWFIL